MRLIHIARDEIAHSSNLDDKNGVVSSHSLDDDTLCASPSELQPSLAVRCDAVESIVCVRMSDGTSCQICCDGKCGSVCCSGR